MGCDTHGIIKQRLSGEQVLEVIQKLFDPEAKMYDKDLKIYDSVREGCSWVLYNEEDTKFIDEHGFICFKYKGERRELFYISNNYKWVKADGTGYIWYDEFEHTWFDLDYWGNSVEIMEKLVAELGGGWVQTNDCSSEEEEYKYHEVKSVEKPAISSSAKVIVMTYEELCKKLGGTVIITNQKMGDIV